MAAEDNVETLAYLGGKMKYNRIRVLVGDEVDLLLDSYGGKAKITRRGK
jgi:translation initiation factor IF-1